MHKRMSPHGDTDHIGSALELVKNFNIKKVIFNIGEDSELEISLKEELNKKNIQYINGSNGIDIGGYDLEFLNTKLYSNENDNSNVTYLNVENNKFLFMADASKTRENDIIKRYNLNDITFLKVGHHGSDTSSSSDFISSINPKYALISVGKKNHYHHPKKSVLNTLKDSTIYRTDIDGFIKIEIDRSGYKILRNTIPN